MKQIILFVFSILMVHMLVSPAFATSVIPIVSVTPVTQAVLPASDQKVTTTTKSSTQVTALQTKALAEIDRRLTALQATLTKITAMKKLAETDKAALTTAIQSEVTKLTDLKAKISSDTDLVTLKADIATIVTQYRIFALYIPKIHLLTAADILGTTIDDLTTLATKLETRITEAETAGMSVTALRATHTSMVEKIADAKKQYESILTNVTPLIPDGYPGNKSTLISARALLTAGRKDIVGASTDAKSIVTSLKAFRPGETTTNASSSATPAVQ